MPDAVLLDTSALPVWRGLNGPLWLSARKLCEIPGIIVYLPELVVHESVNLRAEHFTSVAAVFIGAYSKVERFFDVDPIYVPDVNEIETTWENELRTTFTVIDLDGEDAVDALRREAKRTRPARQGRGGRDSAIWMTAIRLAATHDTVFFVSNNTADFAVGKSGQLHPSLASEVAAAGAQVEYLTSVHGLIERLATLVELPGLDVSSAAQVLRVELREQVLDASAGVDKYDGLGAADMTLDSLTIGDATIKKAYTIGDRNLALVMGFRRVIHRPT